MTLCVVKPGKGSSPGTSPVRVSVSATEVILTSMM